MSAMHLTEAGCRAIGAVLRAVEADNRRLMLADTEERIRLLRPRAGMRPDIFRVRVSEYLQAKRDRRRLLKRYPELRKHAGGAA